MGRAEVQLEVGEGGGRRSTSPLTAPGKGNKRRINKLFLTLDVHHDSVEAGLTTQSSHRSVRVAVSVAALPDVSGLELYGGLDVPHRLLTGLQVQAGEQRDAARPGRVLNSLSPS